MQNLLRCSMLCALSLIISACASKGFNRGELKAEIGVLKPVFDDKEIKAAYDKKANLPKPFKLGVFFKSPKTGTYNDAAKWRWNDQDKTILEEVGKELKAEGLVSDIFPIMNSLVFEEDLKSLRLAAAKHQADALLIISGAEQMDRYTNNFGWTYALLVTALFVPGSQVDTLFVTNATLWDVKNEYLYLTAEAEATSSETYIPAFGKTNKELIDPVKTQSLNNLKTEIKKMVKGTKL